MPGDLLGIQCSASEPLQFFVETKSLTPTHFANVHCAFDGNKLTLTELTFLFKKYKEKEGEKPVSQ